MNVIKSVYRKFYEELYPEGIPDENMKFIETMERLDRLSNNIELFMADKKDKPKWDDSPDWAYFLHLDNLNRWWWLEFPPRTEKTTDGKSFYRGGKIMRADTELKTYPPFTEIRPS